MKEGIEFFEGADFLWFVVNITLIGVRDVEKLSRVVEERRAFFNARGEVAVHAEDVICNHSIVFFVHVVRDNEKKIETREKRIRKRDVLVRIFVNIVLKNRIVRVRWP